MRQIIVLLVLCFLVGVTCSISVAQPVGNPDESEVGQGSPEDLMAIHHGMMGEGNKMDRCCSMKKAMMKMKSEREIVAAGDGGVIVMSGNKLLKYDKNLVLKKEVELPRYNDDSMDMMKMRGKCSMMKKGKGFQCPAMPGEKPKN